MRELVIERLEELAYGEPEIEDSYGEMHIVANFQKMSNADLLALLEDLIGFNG
jgi:hypothetical protein